MQSLDRSDDEVCALLLSAVAGEEDAGEVHNGQTVSSEDFAAAAAAAAAAAEGDGVAGESSDGGGSGGGGGGNSNGGGGGGGGHKLKRIDAYGASVALGIPPAVAGEYLLMAEGHGILCRDDGPEVGQCRLTLSNPC